MNLLSCVSEVGSDWESYICNVNGSLSSVFVDLKLADRAPYPDQPKLAWLWIRLNHPRDDGLSSDDEFDVLCNYEDDLQALITQDGHCRYVGRITTSGRREFYFYIPPDAHFRTVIDGTLRKYPEYFFSVGEKPDALWSQYFEVLYPGKNGREQIEKRRSKR